MKYAIKIGEFFYNPKQLLLIPLYQRSYAWDDVNCKRLFDDIIKVHKNKLVSHFFGSIVSVQDNQLEDDLLIIDGQQRITTISLIVLALKNAVNNGDIVCNMSVDELEETTKLYLYATLRRAERKQKLKPIERDLVAYDVLFSNNPNDFIKDSGVTSNYLFFYDQIVKSGLSFEDIFNALERFIIIDLRLESSDNPQLIFESLNSTGKDLTEADKVRNYLLMSLTKDMQDDYYHKYWRKIEICTDNDPTMFVRDFLTIKLKRICNIDNLYFDFKEFDEFSQFNREDLFKDLLNYAQFYEQILKGKTNSVKLNKKLLQLASIGSTVAMPFYLSFFDFAEKNNVSEDIIFEVLDITENYWARRILCGYPANTLNKIYSTLHNDILRLYSLHQKRNQPLQISRYTDLMKYILLKKQGNAKFPTDTELEESFSTRWIYRLPIDYRYFLFERMENFDSKEGVKPIVQEMKNGTITIEHIMPQTLSHQWECALGDNYKIIHEKYLHTFANLTLTGYNSNYSNRTFEEKKNGYIDKNNKQVYGFKDSSFAMSNYLKTCDVWTEKEILERQSILLERFKNLWGYIETKYEPLDKEVDTVSFADEEYELTGRKLIAFSYKGIRYEVTSWKDMLIQVCQLVYNEYKTTVSFLCQKNLWFHDYDAQEHARIAEDCFVYSSCSTKTKQTILSFLFKHCGILESDLEFHLQPISDKLTDENEE